MKLFEENENKDVHIYMDDSTGKYYYFDGEKLILLGSKPQIGDKGNSELQQKEEEEREKQIEQEQEEDDEAGGEEEGSSESGKSGTPNKPDKSNKKGNDGEPNDEGDEDGDDSEKKTKDSKPGSGAGKGGKKETSDEKLKRLQRIHDKLNDANMGADISHEATDKVTNEKKLKELRKKQLEASKNIQKYKNNPGLTRFKESLQGFIKKEVGEVKNSSWSKINKKYAGTGVIKPGVSKHASGKIPVINVYYDRSGSWDASMTSVGDMAISTLNNYVRQGKLKIYLYYFNTRIMTTDPGRGSGGTAGTPILQHIKETKPDNVIVMTDDDIRDCKEIVTVPGAVWLLFIENSISKNLQDSLKGKKLTKSFELKV